jgi:hypothetical protein
MKFIEDGLPTKIVHWTCCWHIKTSTLFGTASVFKSFCPTASHTVVLAPSSQSNILIHASQSTYFELVVVMPVCVVHCWFCSQNLLWIAYQQNSPFDLLLA